MVPVTLVVLHPAPVHTEIGSALAVTPEAIITMARMGNPTIASFKVLNQVITDSLIFQL